MECFHAAHSPFVKIVSVNLNRLVQIFTSHIQALITSYTKNLAPTIDRSNSKCEHTFGNFGIGINIRQTKKAGGPHLVVKSFGLSHQMSQTKVGLVVSLLVVLDIIT